MLKSSDPNFSPGARQKTFWQAWGPVVYAFVLLAGTWIAYGPATRFEFVNLDDSIYVTANAHVQQGLTWAGLKWAFGAAAGGNWHPLTWVSHMMDCQIFGP